MPQGDLLTAQFLLNRSSNQAGTAGEFAKTLEFTDSLLCRDCSQFFTGLPQTWTTQDHRDFEVMAAHEDLLVEFDDIEQAQRILDRSHTYNLIDMFKNAGDQTCHMCIVIHQAFLDDMRIKQEVSELQAYCDAGSGNELTLRITLQTHYDMGRFPFCLGLDTAWPDRNIRLWTHLYLIPSDQAGLSPTRQTISSSTASDASFAVAKSWLDTCLQNHAECRVHPHHSSKLPARLLDVGNARSTGMISLHTTNEQDEACQYITLSHCWGASKRFSLTRGSLSSSVSGVRVNQLALTFQHAIEITQQLGYRYLWIDSLCIIQDSADDWKTEASKMGEIYRGSVCCISASASWDSEDGCFRSRNPFILRPLKIDSQLFPRLQAFNHSYSTLIMARDVVTPYFTENIENRPLDTRGWTLQESVLAPRTLGYGHQEIFWECLGATASEIWPEGVHGDIWNRALSGYSKSVFDVTRLLPLESKTGCALDDKDILYRRWERLVTEYNQRQLTKYEDVFPALAGMADMMRFSVGDEYCAGLWRGDFRRGLTWITTSRQAKRPEYIAPTWSWASVYGSAAYTDFGRYTIDMECDVEHVHVDQEGCVTSGKVQSGKAVMTGMLRRIKEINVVGAQAIRLLSTEFWPDWLNYMIEANIDTNDVQGQDSLYLFQIHRTTHVTPTTPKDGQNSRVMHALVLEATNISKSEFRRVGYMRSDSRSTDVSSERRLRELSDEEWKLYFVNGWKRTRVTIL